MIVGNAGADEADQRVQKGSFYIVVKELMKTHNLADIDSKVSTDAQQGKPWFFLPKDKEPTSYTPGNAARNLILMNDKISLHPAFSWMWRFGFDKVHSKLTAKKAFLISTKMLA